MKLFVPDHGMGNICLEGCMSQRRVAGILQTQDQMHISKCQVERETDIEYQENQSTVVFCLGRYVETS